jgi:hypothetical protein
MEWKPIETAPKDGTPFLTFSADAARDPSVSALGTKGTPVLAMAWVMGDPSPIDEHGDWRDINCYEPTHWMPLPPAPEPANGG